MESVTLVVSVVLICAAGLVGWALMLRFRRRELQHRERMAALEKGLPLPDVAALESGVVETPRIYLLKGLLWFFAGLALTVSLAGLWWTTRNPIESRIRQVEQLQRLGHTPEQALRMVTLNAGVRREFPLGLCLFGLVPAGVGVAYLAFYRSELRRSRPPTT